MKWALPLMAMVSALTACAASTPDDKAAKGHDGAPDDPDVAGRPIDGAPDPEGGTASGSDKAAADPAEKAPPKPVEGPFSEERVQEIVRANFDKMGACYAAGLKRDSKLKGTINVSLTIDGEGSVVNASAPKSDKPKPKPKKKVPYWMRNKQKKQEELITDTGVVTCVEGEFKALRFPPTGRGLVTLTYPVVFRTE